MQKTILNYGLITGLIMSSTLLFIPKICSDPNNFDQMMFIGFGSILLSGTSMFLGVRSFRNNYNNGSLTFIKGFSVAFLTLLVAAVIYVVTWEIIYFNFAPDFGDIYANHTIEQLKQSGASAEKIAIKMQEMEEFKIKYKNPLYNSAMTFVEPMPIGLVISLICGIALRKKAS